MSDRETARDRLFAAFDLFEFGLEMMTATLRRRHPDATPAELADLLDTWLAERPGAEAGDGPGVPISLDRFR